MAEYNHKEIESRWQKKWAEDKLHNTPDSKKGAENFYTLVEFPYPSGNLHIGHWYAFAVPDIYARFKRMQGFNVLYPIGFDSFGLPAENAAIKRNLDPKEWTDGNIDYMKNQLRSMGASFDWSRELRTSDPMYYKWTQWIFTKFFEKGLAYKKQVPVNWCPSCKTVLANEQVIAGLCERCDSKVEKKEMEQWMLRITDYAERLLKDIDTLDWPEEIKNQQRNWIGKSDGSIIGFTIQDSRIKNKKQEQKIDVFTTRADTLFGATYLVLAPEHQAIKNLQGAINNWDEVEGYIKQAKAKTEIERTTEGKSKTGVELKGVMAINPATKEEIPVWVADYVLGSYGTGAVMAVPAHDERDFEFAKKFNLPTRQVIAPFFIDKENPPKEGAKLEPRRVIQAIIKHPTENKILQVCWKKQPWKTFVIGGAEDGESYEEAVRREVEEETGFKNFKKIEKLGWQMESHFYAAHKDVNRIAYVQAFSIELANLEQDELSATEKELHDLVWVPLEDLHTFNPVSERPEIEAHLKNGPHAFVGSNGKLINSGKFDGLSTEEAKEKITHAVGGKMKTTYRLRDWSVGRQRYWGCPIPIVYDPEGKPHTIPEEHLPWTLPTDVDFKPTGEPPLAKSEELKERTEKIFGKGWRSEVETMDTFIDSSWYFLRYLDSKNEKEFSAKNKQKLWMPVGQYFGGAEHTTLHLLYSRFFQKVLFDLGLVTENEPYKRRLNRGLIMGTDGQKMSKSRGNVIDPDEMVSKIGADSVRMYLAFIGPYAEAGSYPWDMGGIAGVRRFLERVWKAKKYIKESPGSKVLLNQTIKKVTDDIVAFKFNTAISALMVFMNEVEKTKQIPLEDYKILIRLLAPFAPHIAEELWQVIGEKNSVHLEMWPNYDEQSLQSDRVTIVVQVNGKVRASIEVSREENDESVKTQALSHISVKKWTEGKSIKRTIYVPGKLVNIVV